MYYRQYTTLKEQKQKDLERHQFLLNRHYYFFKAKPIKLLNKYERWKGIADKLNLSKQAKTRLSWIIYYETKVNKNASLTARHYGIARKTFYKWYNRFDDAKNFKGLEDKDKTPEHVRQWEISPEQEQRIIKLKKARIRWGKEKIAILYKNEYGEKISSWKVQRVIEKHKLYYHPLKTARIKRKRQRAIKRKRITELQKKKYPGFLLCFDVIVIYWNGVKRYIFTAIDNVSKVAFAHMYKSKSSYNAKDFLQRLYYLLDGKILNAGHDNGSEFAKMFKQECAKLHILQWHSRLHTPKDNPVSERFNQTLEHEFIDLGNFNTDPDIFNRNLTEWLVDYNFARPHQSLNYQTPIQFTEKKLKVLPMWSSSTTD